MCSTDWLFATYYAESIGFGTSVVLNVILLLLIYEKPRNDFGNYKYLMMSFSLCGIVYSMCNFLSKPSVHITKTSFIVFTTLEWSHFSKWFGTVAVTLYGSCYAMMLSLLSIHFFYRYTSVTAPTFLYDRFSLKTFPLWALYVIVYSAIWGLSSYFLCGPTENKDRELAIEFNNAYCLKPDQYAYVGPQYFYESLNDGRVRFHLPSFFGIGIMALLMSSTFACVIYYGRRTYSTLNEDGLTCFARKALQKQLFKTLIIQTVIPFVFMYLPVSLMFTLPIFGMKIESVANIIPISVSIYPCLEPLVAMIFINDFRGRIRNIICFWNRRTRIGTIDGSNNSNSGYSMNSLSTRA